MGLHLSETFDNIIEILSRNKKIMDLMDLPTVLPTDTAVIKAQKLNQVIKQCITKTAESPEALGEKMGSVKIGDTVYDKFGKIRMTISAAQSTALKVPEFGNQRIDICIYYNNQADSEKAIKILDLISDTLSNEELKVKWQDDEGNMHTMYRTLESGFLLSQIASIDNYERVGMRYFFYNSYYNK